MKAIEWLREQIAILKYQVWALRRNAIWIGNWEYQLDNFRIGRLEYKWRQFSWHPEYSEYPAIASVSIIIRRLDSEDDDYEHVDRVDFSMALRRWAHGLDIQVVRLIFETHRCREENDEGSYYAVDCGHECDSSEGYYKFYNLPLTHREAPFIMLRELARKIRWYYHNGEVI